MHGAGGRAGGEIKQPRAALTGEARGASPGSEGEGEAGLPAPHAGCHGNGKPGRRCGQASPTPCQSVQVRLRPACPDRGSQKRRVSRARRRVTRASKAAADRDRGTRRSRPPVACARFPSISVSSGRHGASHAAFRASQSHVRYLGARPLSLGSVFGSPALATPSRSRVDASHPPPLLGTQQGAAQHPSLLRPAPPTLITGVPALCAVSLRSACPASMTSRADTGPRSHFLRRWRPPRTLSVRHSSLLPGDLSSGEHRPLAS